MQVEYEEDNLTVIFYNREDYFKNAKHMTYLINSEICKREDDFNYYKQRSYNDINNRFIPIFYINIYANYNAVNDEHEFSYYQIPVSVASLYYPLLTKNSIYDCFSMAFYKGRFFELCKK